MKAYRLPKGVTESYNSLDELRAAWGLKAFTRQTSDKEKLSKQREDFCKRHICSACKKPMVWTGGNVMSCVNPQCKGIEHSRQTDAGDVVVWYSPSYDLLDAKGAEIANNLFTDY